MFEILVQIILNIFKVIPFGSTSSFVKSIIPLVPLHYIWACSHLTTLCGFMIHLLRLFNPEKKSLDILPWYQISVCSSIVTYILVVYRKFVCDLNNVSIDNQDKIMLSQILRTENTHLLIYASLWAVTEVNIFKILPFAIYSFLNLVNYLICDVYPKHNLSISLKPFICYIEKPLLSISASVDILIIGFLFFEAYRKGTWYALIFYSFVWGLRMEYSEASRSALVNAVNCVDTFVKQDYISNTLRGLWIMGEQNITALFSITVEDVKTRENTCKDYTEQKIYESKFKEQI